MTITTSYPRQRLLRGLNRFSFPARRAPGPEVLRTPPRRAAVLVLFGLNERNQLDVLLTKRAANMKHHPGEIVFPGGGVQPEDVNFFSRTALREAQEEIGLTPCAVTLISVHEPTWVPASNNMVTPVLAWWSETTLDSLAANEQEVESIMRVPLEAFSNASTHVTVNGQPAFRLGNNHGKLLVTGLTATIMYAVLRAGL